MFYSFTNLFSRSHYQNEWNSWEKWQNNQPTSHFDSSPIFQYYLSLNPDSLLLKKILAYNTNYYYVHCFGDFSKLLISTYGGETFEYLALLLDIYDKCKGSGRRITGDPSIITLLREVIKNQSLASLYNQNFEQYEYDYTKIHAHTVAVYSLSTLILRLACNYINKICQNGTFPVISLQKCKEIYTENKISTFNISDPICIPLKCDLESKKSASWPSNYLVSNINIKNIQHVCSICSRLTEKNWGLFNACLDCHMKHICSLCAVSSTIIGTDGLPKCNIHK